MEGITSDNTSELIELTHNLGQPQVLVIGDLMLDRYVWGNATRISQEAPVILLQADKREERLGGASSVATLLKALGAKVSLAGVVGTDQDGKQIRNLLVDLGIDDEAVLVDDERPSTVKERYIGRAQQRQPQQMLRVDYEVKNPLSFARESDLIQAINRQLTHYGYHIGQIVYIGKHIKSSDWHTLSIAKNKSEEFNQKMKDKS